VLARPELYFAADHDPAAVAARVRSAVWERVSRGTYVRTTPPLSPVQQSHARIAAVHHQMHTPHWFSHESAALLCGLTLWRTPLHVHVRQQGHASSKRDRAVRRHRGTIDEARA
jgi:hypothetical protein